MIKAIVLGLIVALGLSGCTDTQSKLAVTYATMKVIEQTGGGESAQTIKDIATKVVSVAEGEGATVELLKEAAMKEVAKLELSPADRILAVYLVDAVAEEIKGKVGIGVIDADQILKVKDVFRVVVDAAVLSGAK